MAVKQWSEIAGANSLSPCIAPPKLTNEPTCDAVKGVLLTNGHLSLKWHYLVTQGELASGYVLSSFAISPLGHADNPIFSPTGWRFCAIA